MNSKLIVISFLVVVFFNCDFQDSNKNEDSNKTQNAAPKNVITYPDSLKKMVVS